MPGPSRLQSLLFRALPREDRDQMQADLLEFFAARRRRSTAGAHVWLWLHTLLTAFRLRWEDVRFSGVGSDARVASRVMRRTPGVTATLILTLGLGIGATTAVFSILTAAFFAPSPMQRPQDLVLVGEMFKTRAVSASYPNFLDWHARTRAFSSAAVFQSDTATLRVKDEGFRLKTYRVSADFMPTFGVAPALGRTLTASDHRGGAASVVVRSHRAWMTFFGGDPLVIDRAFTIDDESRTVVGVLLPGFEFYRDADAWMPIEPMVAGSELEDRRIRAGVSAVARLAPGQSPKAAADEMRAIAAQLAADHTEANQDLQLTVTDLRTAMVGPAGDQLWMLLIAVSGLLLIGVLNAASLMSARIAARQSEFALRASLGAGGGRLFRLVMVEGLTLAGMAGVLSIGVAYGLLALAKAFDPGGVPGLQTAVLNARVLMFGLGIASFIGLVFGLVPVANGRIPGMARGLSGTSRQTGNVTPSRLGAWMVGSQIAVTLVLIAGSALMLQSVLRLFAADLGFDPAPVTRTRIQLFTPGTPEEGRARTLQFYRDLLSRLDALPRVTASAVGNPLPISGFDRQRGVAFEGHPVRDAKDLVPLDTAAVSPGYFKTLSIPITRGEAFDDRHTGPVITAAVIDETAAARWFSGQDAVGKWIQFGANPGTRATIIGVAGAVRQYGPGVAPKPQVYVAQAQWPLTGDVIIRSSGDPLAAAEIRNTVKAVDPSAIVWSVQAYRSLAASAVASPQFSTMVVSLFAVLALGLACVGIYGMVAYDVARRRTEIAVRLALGATGSEVTTGMVRRGMWPVLIGGLAGVGGAIVAARLLSSTLTGATPADPRAYVAALATVLIVALVAAVVPSLRAARVDPLVTLRRN